MVRILLLSAALFLFAETSAQFIFKDTLKPKFEWQLPVIDIPFIRDAAFAEANRRAGGDAQSYMNVQVSDFSRAFRNLSMDQNTEMARNIHGSLYYVHNLLWHKWIPPTRRSLY